MVEEKCAWVPADFEAHGVVNLGEYRGVGTIENAAAKVIALLGGHLSRLFGTEQVQFTFNGTPALVTQDSSIDDVFRDWNARRFDHQMAAGIL